jgi:hypothetical protein
MSRRAITGGNFALSFRIWFTFVVPSQQVAKWTISPMITIVPRTALAPGFIEEKLGFALLFHIFVHYHSP